MKDLPDFALLASIKSLESKSLRGALELTFEFRGTHLLPASSPAPPDEWTDPYLRMVAENGLRWRSLAEVHEASKAFLDPVLAGRLDLVWVPEEWTWKRKTP